MSCRIEIVQCVSPTEMACRLCRQELDTARAAKSQQTSQTLSRTLTTSQKLATALISKSCGTVGKALARKVVLSECSETRGTAISSLAWLSADASPALGGSAYRLAPFQW